MYVQKPKYYILALKAQLITFIRHAFVFVQKYLTKFNFSRNTHDLYLNFVNSAFLKILIEGTAIIYVLLTFNPAFKNNSIGTF